MQKEQDKNMKNRKKLVGYEWSGWDTYLENKRMKNLSFFTIAKSKVKNILNVGVCR